MSYEIPATRQAHLLNCGVPEHDWDGLSLWIDEGINPGSFLMAVLRNDLREACSCADAINRHALFAIVLFLSNHAPYPCWGTEAFVAQWRRDHQMRRDKAAALAKAESAS